MGQLVDLQETRRRLGLALEVLSHDRWVVGFLRGGALQPVAASEISRRLLQAHPLQPLSRRALFEQRPVVVNSVFPYTTPAAGFDWELDWPAILYAPVGEMGERPIGLLTIGCRFDHWYTEEDVAYAYTLGYNLAPLVAAMRGPLSKLNESEGEVAQLLSYGLSAQEIAKAIRQDERHTRSLIDGVTKKFRSVTDKDLMFPIVQWKRREFRL
jgi:DNA-binding CsgD family transcriptional regulator